ncbi:MAG: PspC domain-containing protein [Chlorobi bacterium]|nr:PspC domain-containing protein [Chlorobiota bacterium]
MDPRKLKRSSDRYLGGVLGGIAEYFEWRPAIVRIGYVILSFFSAAFPGIIVYIVLWIVMEPPEE